jgi:HPt (histidine-containing phosphotransfer) domain-containing protein
MTAPSGILDFFVLEASEYIEQLDGLVAAGGPGGPNAEAFQRAARALRGSATMARLSGFADLAAALERAARALRDGSLRWSAALRGAIVGAVDDLKILVRAARTWGEGETRRAAARAAEISGFLPAERPSATATPANPASPAFLAAETANIAAGLELLLTGPADPNAPANVMQRLRALRGIASIRDVPPLPDVLEAADEAARPLETPGGELPAVSRELVEAAAALLRDAARSLRANASSGAGAGPVAVAPEINGRFEAALARFAEADQERGRIVPVSQLFFDDGGPHIVSATPNPPTTPAERFRLEMVGQGEYLRGLVIDARSSGDPGAIDRARRTLRRALAALRTTAESFDETAIADTIAAVGDSLATLDASALAVLTGLAELLSSPGHDSDRLRSELPRLLAGRAERGRVGAVPAEPPVQPPRTSPMWSDTSRPEGTRQPTAAPTGGLWQQPSAPRPVPSQPAPPPAPVLSGLASLLDMGIASVEELGVHPLSDAVPVEETVVPIESLIYRGEAALQRARELRDDLRQLDAPPREALEELYDLLDLVTE